MTDRRTMFAHLAPQKPDALLALIAMHRADQRTDTIDVGVGVYRDEAGRTPVMRAVKAAEALLIEAQDSKAYLGAEGDARFAALIARLALGGEGLNARRFGLQTPGGTGALRVGAELLARATPDARVWIGRPTWPNHHPIFAEAGVKVIDHPFFDAARGGVDFGAMMAALEDAKAGDAVLLHGCCHNPTGAQLTAEQWASVAALCAQRGLIPFVDLAYQGLGDGLDADAVGARTMFDAVPAALMAYSCDKNFALYRDRVGALIVQAEDGATRDLAYANALSLSRALWSMPPDHGAAVARIILDDADLAADWRTELDEMRERLNAVRAALADAHPMLAPVATQRGLFSRLPIDAASVAALQADHGIYMPDDGRINLAGLNRANLPRFVVALAPHLERVTTPAAA